MTSITYLGERHVTRRTRVRAASGNVFSYNTQTHDRDGRMIKVCESQAEAFTGTCTGIETTYLYDVGSRLTRVCENRVDGACGQIRRFVYDHRGAMTQERHPEIGVNSTRSSVPETTIVDSDGFEEVETTADIGNDWTFYTVDSRGNVLAKDVEGSTQFDLAYEYDAAGRLIRIDETAGGNPRPLKEFFYGLANVGSDLRAGKLVQTRRHNWVDIIGPLAPANSGALDAIITETFRYEGPGGRPSARQTRFSFNDTTHAFNVSQTYDFLGNVDSITYPECIHSQGDCAASSPNRTVAYGYDKGYMTSVPGFADSITYQAARAVHQIAHSNGVTYTYAIDPATGLSRPHEISTTAGWSTGTYGYDGSGNIQSIGTQQFRYDRAHRLVSGQVLVGASLRTQTVNYDVHGNITSITTNGSLLSTPTDATSNRLSDPMATYDGAGNLAALDFGNERYEYEYDAVNMMKHLRSDTDLARIFLYNAADERIAQFDCVNNVCQNQGSVETWTLRGLDNRILRTYLHPWNEGWQWKEDYVYAAGRLIATVNAGGAFAAHTDHLGTVRQVTDSAGNQVALHSYYPFGQEATSAAQDDLTVKFTGHERDSNTGRGVLDYLHARYCSPIVGRFSGVDPKRLTEATGDPQRWNRYTYAGNNPIVFVDPNGEAVETGWDVFNVVTGGATLAANLAAGNFAGALVDAGGLVLDIAATAVPGVPAVGTASIKAIRAARLTRNKVIGEAFEKAVLKALDLSRNTKRVTSSTKGVEFRVPDGLIEGKGGIILEIKAGTIGSRSKKQISDFVKHAKAEGQQAVLAVAEGTKLPQKILDLVKDEGLAVVKFNPQFK